LSQFGDSVTFGGSVALVGSVAFVDSVNFGGSVTLVEHPHSGWVHVHGSADAQFPGTATIHNWKIMRHNNAINDFR
jgi:hypothetical protein